MKSFTTQDKHEQEFVVLVDDDFDIEAHEWRAVRMGNVRYVVNKQAVGIHRLVMDAQKGQIVDHINGNGLDNRRENLRFVTPSENGKNRHPGQLGPKEDNGTSETSIRLSRTGGELRDAVAKKMGLNKKSVYELAIREFAAKHGVTVED